MPLTRYEIRNEYSLSNPELYRAVAKDDPEGLLEGVAMAGLVGIVRQLGDLADFAAEVFHDLHEEVSATAARGHDLLVRIQQLEVELPVIEKLMLVELNHMNFHYNPGVEWHANICNEQNHLTQGDLPRFIRHAYQDCRGPPRLSLLDKFDVAGAGACLKRYTDPSFFKTEWASSELLKAEREQLNKRARKNKMKIHRRRNKELREAVHASHLHTRTHHSPLDVDTDSGTQIHSPNNASSVLDVEGKSSIVFPTLVLRVEKVVTSSTVVPPLDLTVEKSASLNSTLKSDDPLLLHGHATSQHSQRKLPLECNEDSSNLLESHVHDTMSPRILVKGMVDETDAEADKVEVKSPTDAHLQNDEADLHFKSEANQLDAASEIEHCMDALTTMNSELDIEPEFKTKPMADHGSSSEVTDKKPYKLFHNQPPDNLHISHKEDLNTDETNIIKYIENPVLMNKMGNVTPRQVSQISQADVKHISNMIQESSNESLISSLSPVKHNRISETEDYLDSESIDHVSETPQISEVNDYSYDSDKLSATFQPLPDSCVKHDRISETEDYLDSESIDHVSETPQISEVNDYGYDSDKLSTTFHPLPDPAISFVKGSHIGSSMYLGSLSSQEQEQTHEMFHQAAKIPALERDNYIRSESEPSESCKELSPCSSAGSSVHHTQWRNAGSSKNLSDTDDDISVMQISSSSLSSSTLSSPRPSTLTTTVFNMELGGELQSLLLSPESVESSPKSLAGLDVDHPPSLVLCSEDSMGSSPRSLDGISSKSLTKSAPHSPLTLIQTAVSFSKSPVRSMPESPVVSLQQLPADDFSQSEPSGKSNPRKDGVTSVSPRLPIEEPEHLPPHPPLPPLEWRMMIRTHSTLSSSSKNLESSLATQSQDDISVQDLQTRTYISELKLEGNSDLPSETGSPPADSCPDSSIAGSEVNFLLSEISLKGSVLSSTEDVGSVRLNEAGACEASLDPETEGLSDSSPPFSPDGSVPDPGPVKFGRKDSLIKAFALHHRTALKFPELSHFSRSGGLDGREVLLEQIRTGSFTLRHTKIEKQEPPRQSTHINVAAILEKANAIRQAFVGSDDEDDDDDDWSDS